jgi:hypothetical protein
MANINNFNPKKDLTVQIFDNFYDYQQAVSGPEYDAVYSYLLSVFGNATQAGNFTVTMFRMAAASNIPVMELLQSLQGLSKPQITVTFAFYLNTFQSPATKLGVIQPTSPNYYVAHNIKQ